VIPRCEEMPADARPQARKTGGVSVGIVKDVFRAEHDAGACRSSAAVERHDTVRLLWCIGFVDDFLTSCAIRSYFLGPHGKKAMSAHADVPAGVAENAEVVTVTKLDLRAPGCSANDAPAHGR
jgi:hypothetical protein